MGDRPHAAPRRRRLPHVWALPQGARGWWDEFLTDCYRRGGGWEVGRTPAGTPDAVEFCVLGPVEMRVAGRSAGLGPPQQRLVLAALALDAGRPVGTATLIDRIWDEAPNGARRALHVHITRLRRLLTGEAAAEPLVRRSGGYVLDVDPDQVDALRFERLLDRAREPDCTDGDRLGLLRQAVALWR